jgi:hypothetical protein
MKKKNNIYIYGIVLVALLVMSYFVMRETSGEKKTLKLAEKLFTLDSLAIDKLEMERNGKKVTLEKKGGLWNVTVPVLYTANQQFAASVVSSLKNYKISSIVSDNPNNKNTYGFSDTNVTKLNVYQNGALSGTILIGNASTGASQTYIKKAEGNQIFLAEEFLYNNFVKPDLSEWRDKTVIAIPAGAIKSIDFYPDGEKYTVLMDSTGRGYIGKDSVSTAVFDGVKNMLQNFNTQNFKDTTISADSKSSYGVKVFWGKETEFRFFKYGDTEAKRYLLQVSGINQIFEMDENFVKMLVKPRKEMLGQK